MLRVSHTPVIQRSSWEVCTLAGGEIAKARFYTTSEMLAHFSDCQPTKAVLKDLEELRASAVSEDEDIVEQKTQKKVKKPYW